MCRNRYTTGELNLKYHRERERERDLRANPGAYIVMNNHFFFFFFFHFAFCILHFALGSTQA